MNPIAQLFINPELDFARLAEINAMQEPRSRYFIAITPRSGSTYLCDVLHRSRRFGKPQEILDTKPIALRLPIIPARTPEEYLRNVLKVHQSANGVSGTKASWFQWQQFKSCISDKSIFTSFNYIYLTRHDTAAQAVSLYKATASSVFHSAAINNEEALIALNQLNYDYIKIKYWYDHIIVQQQGWQQYFHEYAINPLYLYYEDIDNDLLAVLKRIAVHVNVLPKNVFLPTNKSAYTKISDERNADWACRFAIELNK